MNFVTSGLAQPFEVTFDSSLLYVGMTIYDVTSGLPGVLVGSGPVPMVNVYGNTYVAQFNPTDQHMYLLVKQVFNDSGLTSPNTSYSMGSETISANMPGSLASQILNILNTASSRLSSAQYVGYVYGQVVATPIGILQSNPFATIIQGGKTALICRFINTLTGDPFDLTGITQITTCFQNQDGTEIMLTLMGGAITVVGNPLLGKIMVSLTSAQTAVLMTVSVTDLELAFQFGSSDPIKSQISGAYLVTQSLC